MPTDPTPLLATDAPAGRRGICAILGDALRIDFSARLDHEVLDSKIRGMPTQHRDARRDVRMASYAHVTEGAVRQMYDDNADPYWTSERADKVVLVLKLGLALSHAGLNSVEVESDMRNCAEALGLPRGTVSVGNRTLTATFGTGAAHTITVVEGFAIHQLNDVHEVAKCIQADLATQVAEDEQQYVLKLAALVDQIMERDSVYSPLIDELADSCFRAASVLAIFDGSVQDVLWVGMLSIVCKLAVRLGALIGIPAGLNAFKHAARVGFIVPLLTFYAEVPYCRLPIIYMALVVCELPGTDLLLGAYELYNGSLVGAARMVHCIVDVAFLGLSLSIGWMIYGVVDDPNRKEAFTLPTKWCEMEPSAWWHSAILYQARGARRTHRLPPIIVDPIPFGLCNYINLGMRLREIPLCLTYFLLTVGLAGALMEYVPQFPGYIGNCLVMFLGAAFSCFHEYFAGVPYTVPMTPIFLNLAPGLPAFVAIVNQMNAMELGQPPQGDPWLDLLMQGVTYGLGASVAIEMWRPVLARQQANRTKQTVQKLLAVKQTKLTLSQKQGSAERFVSNLRSKIGAAA